MHTSADWPVGVFPHFIGQHLIPGRAVSVLLGYKKEIRLIRKIPGEESWMAAIALAYRLNQPALCLKHERISIWVASQACGELSSGDSQHPAWVLLIGKRPHRPPVDARHMAGEEGGHDFDTRLVCHIKHDAQIG